MTSNRSGFTIVELLIAVVVLSVGFLALGAGLGKVTQTLTGSRITTEANQLATRRMDRLRAASRATTAPCTSTTFTSSSAPVVSNGVTQTWSVPVSGSLRAVLVISSYSMGRNRTKVDTLATNISCA
ncbi:MAG TPA: prepilin-type N-terminal cleavage/methylation domain-containing protein [Gemmatimonadales bacterium]|nr:prepilin-type N-terminal cleavage/methylation domain-containing protein [Gemmatimonadales bacterium]